MLRPISCETLPISAENEPLENNLAVARRAIATKASPHDRNATELTRMNGILG